MTFYLRVDEPIRLTTGSIRVSKVLSGLGQKFTRTEICRKISTQSDLNLWWARL